MWRGREIDKFGVVRCCYIDPEFEGGIESPEAIIMLSAILLLHVNKLVAN